MSSGQIIYMLVSLFLKIRKSYFYFQLADQRHSFSCMGQLGC